MNILTVENGKLENQKIEVKLEKETELDHNRPGFSREKLKKDLRNKILNQRREELKSKCMESEPIEFEPEKKSAKDSEQHDELVDVEVDDEELDDEEVDDEDEEDSAAEEEESLCKQKKKKSKEAGCSFLDEQVRMNE